MTEYATTDLNVAAFLIARGWKLRRLDGPRTSRSFVFEAAAKDDVQRFFLNELVGARDFASALKQLKSALHHTP